MENGQRPWSKLKCEACGLPFGTEKVAYISLNSTGLYSYPVVGPNVHFHCVNRYMRKLVREMDKKK
jgi:hypothetical protein